MLFLTFCVIWSVFENAGSHLFRVVFLFFFLFFFCVCVCVCDFIQCPVNSDSQIRECKWLNHNLHKMSDSLLMLYKSHYTL